MGSGRDTVAGLCRMMEAEGAVCRIAVMGNRAHRTTVWGLPPEGRRGERWVHTMPTAGS